MKKKQYKTGESQRKAAQTYKTAHNVKSFSITMKAEEYEASRQVLTAHNLTPLQAWRRLMSELNAEPLPNPDNGKKNESPD